jgi:phage FluMu protein gp41
MVDFLEHNVITWGGSIWHADAYTAGESLGVSSYPFVALLMCKPREVHVVTKVEGAVSAEALLDRISAAMARFQDQVDNLRRAQREREATRQLREEQVGRT